MPPVRAARIHPYRRVGHFRTAAGLHSIRRAVNLVSKLRAEALAARALPVLSSGLVSGLYMVIYVFSRGRHHFLGRTGAILLARHRRNPVRNLRRLPRDRLDQRLPRRDLGAAVACHRGTGRDWLHDSPAGRRAVHDHGCDHDGRRVGGRNLLPDDRAIPARQPGAVHPLFRGGGISRRNGRSPVPGRPCH